jgi:hypothetical protein
VLHREDRIKLAIELDDHSLSNLCGADQVVLPGDINFLRRSSLIRVRVD